MKLQAHDVVVVVGIRGSGKTYWVRRNVVRKAGRVVVWDPHGEYETTERRTVDELLADPSPLDRERVHLAVVPAWQTPLDLAEEFQTFVELLGTCESMTVVVDEVGLLRKHGAEWIELVACQSRHWECPLILVAQRAVQIPMTAREQMSHLVSFRQSSPADVAALVERCGDAADKVRALPRRQCWLWSEQDSFEDVERDDGPDATAPAGANQQELVS